MLYSLKGGVFINQFYLKVLMLFYYAINGVMLPFLPVLFQLLGFNYQEIGILLASGAVINLITQSFWGYLCDKVQTVKKLLLLQLALSAIISTVVFQFHSFWVILLTFIIFYVFYRPIPALIDTLVLSQIKDKPSQYGSFRMFGSIGFLLTVFFSGYLLNRIGIANIPFMISGLIVLTFFCVLPVRDAKYLTPPPKLKDLGYLAQEPGLLLFLTATTLLAITQMANDNFITVHLKALGGTIEEAGVAWAIGVTSEVAAFIVLSRINSTRYGLKLLMLSAILYGFRWALMAFITSIKFILIVQLLHGICFALFISQSINFLIKTVPDQLRSTGQGVFYMFCFGLGGIIGTSGGGWLLEKTSSNTFYATGLVLAILALVSFIKLEHSIRQPQIA